MEKTLLITSIYSDLWGTEYGGRPSRKTHYKQSLLNIININVEKIICFTSSREIDDLNKFFYMEHNISKDLLELRVFDLKDSKFFDKIRDKKDTEKMKQIDRCYEIQYNKFFWYDLISNVNDYDRVYWIDAGLSHSGLFPKKFRQNNSYYQINLFDENFLKKININTEDKVLLLSKNNSGKFLWSQTLPRKYYTKYNNSRHIIGGLFGGTPNNYKKFRDKFEILLEKLLSNENSLFMEELLMSNLYYEDSEFFHCLKFDDWFQRSPENNEDKYFYQMFL